MAGAYQIEFANRQRAVRVALPALKRAARVVLSDERVARAEISVALVDDAEMQALNQAYLGHDYPTDVISFLLDSDLPDPLDPCVTARPRRRGAGQVLEGEILLGAEYAVAEATTLGWETASELTLYLVHGLLHLCGYDDLSPAEKRIMRRRERELLAQLGIEARYRKARPAP